MNKDQLTAMAREAGFDIDSAGFRKFGASFDGFCQPELERFAALVAAAKAKEYEERLRFTQERWEIECQSQVEIEREACAKVCDGLQDVPATEPRHCAQDIRARSNT